MEIKLKITQVLPAQEGVGKNGNPWKLQGYVGTTFGDYPKSVAFEVFGEDRIQQNPAEVDDIVNVSFDIESRESNGRWFTSIRAWKIAKAEAAAEPVTPKPEPKPVPQVEGAENEDTKLPF